MASLYLATLSGANSEWHLYPKNRIEESYAYDVHKKHSLVHSPDDADIILFATNANLKFLGIELIYESVFKSHSEKCVLFDSSDNPSPLIGGLCASWPRIEHRNAASAIGWCYHHPTASEPYIDSQKFVTDTRYLWSFNGSACTHPIRKKLFSLDEERAYLKDTSNESLPNLIGKTSEKVREQFRKEYVNSIYSSKFIICPRGRGASSMRIFEAMRAGRAPVLISNQWTPPPFVKWSDFSLNMKEEDIGNLPDYLRKNEGNALEMGRFAQNEWNRVFGLEGLFHYTVESALLILESRSNRSRREKFTTAAYLIKSKNARALARDAKNALVRRTSRWRQRC